MSKIINIPGRIHSTEKGNVSVGANEVLDDTKGKKQNVINSETDAELLRLSNEKQDNLTFDNAPTENSNNPVKSGGVYAADKALSDAIEAILLLIPSAATELNKLVDLATMNSSISTATATFRGTYNAVTDLGLTYQATHEQIAAALDALNLSADNNDYAFVQVPVSDESTEIRRTERYKHNGTNWGYEYDLNTSGFTAAQWAALNSGITALLVAKLGALPTAAELTTLLGQKQDTLTFDTEPMASSTNPVTSGGVYAAILAVSSALSTYQALIDPKIAAIEGMIPSGASSSNQLTAKDYVDGIQTTLQGYIDAINGKIPAAAATNNKLTDKNYVDTIIAGITALIPSAASGENKLVDTAAMMTYVASIINTIDASFNVTSTDGHITLHITQVDGVITSVQVQGSDIASAAALTLTNNNITSLTGRMGTAETNIANLQQLYNDLQQSKPVPVTALPSTGQQQGVIYRLAGTTSYSDYMWNGTSWVLMATYNNAIDNEPTVGSNNLVKSGGVAEKLYIYPENQGYINETGGISSTSAWRCSDMFPVVPNSVITVFSRSGNGGDTYVVGFYGANREFLKDVSPISTSNNWDTKLVTVPSGAYWAIMNTAYNSNYQPYCYLDKSFLETAGRIYESSLISGKSVSGDGSVFTYDGYIKLNGDIQESASSWKYTDYIVIPTGSTYKAILYGAPNDAANMVFYDNQKNIVANGIIIPSESGITTLTGTVPNAALYVRMCSFSGSGNLNKVKFTFESSNILQTIETAISDVSTEVVKLEYRNNFMGKPFSFNGKTAAFFGDSVTYGVKSDPLSAAEKPYREWLCERLGLTGTNYAISATYICDPSNDPESILNQVLTNITAQSDFDFIFIAGGINDFWTGKPLGIISDSTYATFYGALNVMCNHLKTALSGKDTEVIFFTPINCTRSDLSQAIASLDAYRNAIFRVAAMNGFNVIDTSVIGFPNDISDSVYRAATIADGVHPTEYGHKMMGLNLVALLS